MKLPTRKQCFELMKKYEMPENIIKHSLIVNKLSVSLAKKLKDRGEDVNIDLVDRASLLHDIGKIFEIRKTKSGGWHGEIGYKILKREGFPEIAVITRKHVLSYFLRGKFNTWEEKIIQYADDRVNHDKIVTLNERFKYLLKRYGISKTSLNQFKKIKPLAEKLEAEINKVMK